MYAVHISFLNFIIKYKYKFFVSQSFWLSFRVQSLIWIIIHKQVYLYVLLDLESCLYDRYSLKNNSILEPIGAFFISIVRRESHPLAIFSSQLHFRITKSSWFDFPLKNYEKSTCIENTVFQLQNISKFCVTIF